MQSIPLLMPLVLQLLIGVLLFVWILTKLKALLISSTCSFRREIEHQEGEYATFNINFYVFEPVWLRTWKYFRNIEVAERRKTFTFERFQAIIEEGNKSPLSLAKGE